MTKPKFIENLLKIANSLGYCSRRNRLLFLTIFNGKGGAVLKTDTQQLIICFRPQKARNTVSRTRYRYKQLCKTTMHQNAFNRISCSNEHLTFGSGFLSVNKTKYKEQ